MQAGELSASSISRESLFAEERLSVQRNNLLGICKMCVKSLVDKAAFEPITDSCPHLLNFCTVLEHIFTHRIEFKRGLFAGGEQIQYWVVLTKFAPPVTITSILDMEEIQTDLGKGRAWFRLTLVQKRLSTFIASLLSKWAQLNPYYLPGAFLCSDLMTELSGTLKCLDAIDFNLCLRGQDFDFGSRKEISFTPYLTFHQSSTSIADDSREEKRLRSKVTDTEDSTNEEGEESVTQIRESFIAERDQKNYFEELVSVRDMQLSSVRSELAAVSQEADKQKKELEEVILELQQQISSLQSELRGLRKKPQSNGQILEEPPSNTSRRRATSLFSSLIGSNN